MKKTVKNIYTKYIFYVKILLTLSGNTHSLMLEGVKMSIVDTVRNIVEKKLNDAGIKVYNIEYVKEDGNYFLRIIIDKETGVDLDTCIEATNIINPLLDSNNLEIENYILDVCSKGGN